MEHTKGELKVTPIKTIAFAATGKQFAVLTKGGLSEKELQDRAIRFVKCWNSHDDLLAACERVVLMFGCQRLESSPKCTQKDNCCICNAEQAIAKAKL